MSEIVHRVRETACERVRTVTRPDYTGRGAYRGAPVRVHLFLTPEREVQCERAELCRECLREAAA